MLSFLTDIKSVSLDVCVHKIELTNKMVTLTAKQGPFHCSRQLDCVATYCMYQVVSKLHTSSDTDEKRSMASTVCAQ